MSKDLTLEIYHDYDVDSPCEGEGEWKLYSFSDRHASYRNPYDFFPDGEASPELQAQLDEGTAWLLSYFEHGLCQWMLKGAPKGLLSGDWQWDGVDLAGVLIWENPVEDLGAETKEARRESAAEFVEIYTQWCNGETYQYTLTDADGSEVGGYGGIIGTDHLISTVLEELGEGGSIARVEDKVTGLTVEDFRR